MAPKSRRSAKKEAASIEKLANDVKDLSLDNNRTASGVLTSHKDSRDIKIESFSLSFYSQILVQESTIELNFGRRYGLLGANGSGKSTFLECLAAREVPIPEHIDIYLLKEEFPPTEMTALEAVIQDATKEVAVSSFNFGLIIFSVWNRPWKI
jgi:ATP-binding cassette subfamily F protein 2